MLEPKHTHVQMSISLLHTRLIWINLHYKLIGYYVKQLMSTNPAQGGRGRKGDGKQEKRIKIKINRRKFQLLQCQFFKRWAIQKCRTIIFLNAWGNLSSTQSAFAKNNCPCPCSPYVCHGGYRHISTGQYLKLHAPLNSTRNHSLKNLLADTMRQFVTFKRQQFRSEY